MNNSPSLGLLLHRLGVELDHHSDQVLQRTVKIGFSQYKILIVLLEQTDVRQKTIAEALGQTEASVSRQIGQMADDGLIWSAKDLSDKRGRITRLTKKGEQVAIKATSILERHYQPMFARLSEPEQKILRNVLEYFTGFVSHSERED